MITSHTVDSLQTFERTIASDFDSALIRAPVHLEGGNEEQLLDIFRDVRPQDWVLCTWRSHLKCLLKGVPPQRLREDILAGRSITLTYPEYRIVSSAIVGGVLPIATGIALSIKRESERLADMAGDTYDMHLAAIEDGDVEFQQTTYDSMVEDSAKLSERPAQVWCFVGDMTACTGIFQECDQYACGHDLPIWFIIEDNGKSVCTDTREAWGYSKTLNDQCRSRAREYEYRLPWPHSGAGTHVRF